MSPRTLFRIFATAEAFTWGALLIALALRAFGVANLVPIAGGLHGFVVLSYVVATVMVWVNNRWRLATGVLAFVLSVIPFATVPFEIVLDRKGLLAGGWRLRPGGEEPRGIFERVQALILRRPLVALGVLFAGVVVMFVVLLWLGPPVPKA